MAFADEGVTLREAGITMPVVVLNADSDSFEIMIGYGLEPEIYSFSSLEAFSQAVRRHGETRYPIHLKLDTGMHRLGFTESDIDGVLIIPKDVAPEVIEKALVKASTEKTMRKAMEDGMMVTDAFAKFGVL